MSNNNSNPNYNFDIAESFNWITTDNTRSGADLSIALHKRQGRLYTVGFTFRNGRGKDITRTQRFEFCVLKDRILFREATDGKGFKLSERANVTLTGYTDILIDKFENAKDWIGDYNILFDEVYGFHYILKKGAR